ncbi:MAG: PHP domain-containing protein [Clostridia bacterium]|nr:PHP domain-containing protein [Clostridia bacterium]
MKIDGHTHPNLLKVPSQGDDFIRRAAELGFDSIIFTDHMPFTVTGDEHDRIPFGMVSDYCLAVKELSEKYRNIIGVACGIEIDYRKSCEDEIREVLSCGSFVRVLGSSHLNIKGFSIPFGKLTRSEYAARVIENYIDAADSGLFDVMTHIDVYRWVFSESETYPLADDGFYVNAALENLLRHLFLSMEKRNIALEYNTSPLFKKFDSDGAYPAREILNIASDYTLRYTYGSDAHAAHHVGFAYDSFEKIFKP